MRVMYIYIHIYVFSILKISGKVKLCGGEIILLSIKELIFMSICIYMIISHVSTVAVEMMRDVFIHLFRIVT